jgi:uncharacterized protein YuzE
MKITYDKSVDAAYVYLVDIEKGGVKHTETIILPSIGNALVNIDLNEDGKIIGIEVLNASKVLPEMLLQ